MAPSTNSEQPEPPASPGREGLSEPAADGVSVRDVSSGRADDVSASDAPAKQGPPPTVRQVFGLARVLLERAGLPWPRDRAEASSLLTALRAEQEVR